MSAALVGIGLAFLLVALVGTRLGSDAPPPQGQPDLPGGHNEWDNQIRYAAVHYGLTDSLHPLLVKAVIDHESAQTWDPEILGDYDPDLCPDVYAPHPYGNRVDGTRVSTAGWCGLGLMQVNRHWHPGIAGDLLEGNTNILMGTQILAGWLRQYGVDWRRALAGYNGGGAAARAWPDASNQVRYYVSVVETRLRRYAVEVGVEVA